MNYWREGREEERCVGGEEEERWRGGKEVEGCHDG